MGILGKWLTGPSERIAPNRLANSPGETGHPKRVVSKPLGQTRSTIARFAVGPKNKTFFQAIVRENRNPTPELGGSFTACRE
jgi:hypothetical protein